MTIREIKILIVIILLFIGCRESKAEEFQIKHADSLEVNQGQIIVKGNIVINYKDASIEAPFGKLEANNEGEVEKATFTGRTKLKLKDRLLKADNITVLVKEKRIYAEGNTESKLKDKKNNFVIISSDSQELFWSGEGASAKGNLMTTYQNTKVNSDEAYVVYKNKKPDQAIFLSKAFLANIQQPTNSTFAKEIIFDLPSHNLKAVGNVKSVVWPDQKKLKSEQDPIFLHAEDLFVDNNLGIVRAKAEIKRVMVSYQDIKGESKEALFVKNKENGKPEKIIFKGDADVSQIDKRISSDEVVLDFNNKKLTSSSTGSARPKTVIFKK